MKEKKKKNWLTMFVLLQGGKKMSCILWIVVSEMLFFFLKVNYGLPWSHTALYFICNSNTEEHIRGDTALEGICCSKMSRRSSGDSDFWAFSTWCTKKGGVSWWCPNCSLLPAEKAMELVGWYPSMKNSHIGKRNFHPHPCIKIQQT